MHTLVPENKQYLPERQTPVSGKTFCLVHGSWHGSWCWELLRERLESRGHRVEAVDVPVDQPDYTYEDYADIVAERIDDPKNSVVLTHSRAGNIGPLVAQRKAIGHLVYLCAGFDKINNVSFQMMQSTFMPVPRKSNRSFTSGIKEINGKQDLYVYDQKRALKVFYHDCPEDVALAAADHLRPTYRRDNQPAIMSWPNVDSTFIYGRYDRVIRPKYSQYIARALGLRAIELSSGHSPFLSQPEVLAQTLDEVTANVHR